MPFQLTTAAVMFVAALLAIFGVAIFARHRSTGDVNGGLAEMKFNRWLVGLGASTTANSGFVAMGSVAVGYLFGLKSLVLAIGWLLGDIVFWYFFPARINRVGRESQAITVPDILNYKLTGGLSSALRRVCTLIILTCLMGFLAAQWLAGQKFLAHAFAVPGSMALALFAVIIIAYSMIGGFRGSMYTDVLLAAMRIVGSVVALTVIASFALDDRAAFARNIAEAGTGFMSVRSGGIVGTASFMFGFALAGICFGLGQPHVLNRYLSGSSPEETRAAWWIYICSGQFMWVSMMVFGALLRGVMPGIADPQLGLSIFFQTKTNAVLTGIIFIHVFATNAAASNALLVTMAQTITPNAVPRTNRDGRRYLPIAILLVGIVSVFVACAMHGPAYDIALSLMPIMGAGLAAGVMIKVLGWRHSAASLLCAVLGGIIAAAVWHRLGFSSYVNEPGIGTACGLLINWLVMKIFSAEKAPMDSRPL